MNDALRERIEVLAIDATPEKLEKLIKGWDRYFLMLNIGTEEQDREFDGIMRARVNNGSISIVAPLWRLMT